MKPSSKINLWKSIENHARSLHLYTPTTFKEHGSTHFPRSISSSHIQLDYSNQHITDETLTLLLRLAECCDLQEKIQAMMRGDKINISENQPALHTALRASKRIPIYVDARNVMTDVLATRHKMQRIVEQIRNKQWLGFSGKPITDIVNIGIGGSDLGPRFCLHALSQFRSVDFGYHFISDADPNNFQNTVARLNPETTLFIVSSKSFTTQETLYNARKAMKWIGESAYHQKHFIAVTAHIEKAHQFGINTVLPIWNWVGGRYSICSAINLISAILIGFEPFNQFLAGANHMDQHFLEAELSNNLPILLALLGIWNNNFLHIHHLLLLTYAQPLDHFVPYIQQLDMESNGKSIDNQGKTLNYATGPIVWGGPGNQAQHSYFQLLAQGTHKVASEFITLKSYAGKLMNTISTSNMQVLTTGIHDSPNPNDFIPGHMPINHIQLEDCSPYAIGELIALYEHKIFTQSVIWDINPFDQPGVESAKRSQHNIEDTKRSSDWLKLTID